MRDELLERGYSIVIDSTAPDNTTREFLLTTKVKHVNWLLICLNVEREILTKRNREKFGDASKVYAWDKRWEKPMSNIPIFLSLKTTICKILTPTITRLKELLESETYPFKPEFHPALLSLKEIKEALKNF